MNLVPNSFLEPHAQVRRPGLAASKSAHILTAANTLAKAAFDRVSALLGLILVSPVLLVIAVLIAMGRDGPVLFGHVRVGRGGQLFPCYKFRTMVPDGSSLFNHILSIDPVAREEWQLRRKVQRDPRVSRLGAFLRSSSLDELPQLWNVLRGDMSLVGPRPVTAEEMAQYSDNARDYLCVRPGITGAWQVSGRSECTYAERVALDVDYVRNQSFARDMAILLRTVTVVLRRQGAS